ncbi:hypothetical protein MY04_4795 [Flammeovirga sp. MY04]|uniref:hypothetical protein n=1 Tax=Flammeovirga sp. MY04 TaxID=1191459 RepID=UPI0008062616|nr:hypothetical protein [Flammeovirga sp. MY04]ANQ49612.1 hypothetical protein MY04_2238 [Flammeovirga sp. MY04]ANQ52130.1 hypothetical protein MY04_4795 [Flammeovirga sp. MY04]
MEKEKQEDRLKEMALRYFEQNPKADVYHLFNDGMGFGDYAKSHKDQYAKKSFQECTTFKRKDFFPEKTEDKKIKTSEPKS